MSSTSATAAKNATPAHAVAADLIALVHVIESCSQAFRGALDRVAGQLGLGTSQLTTLWVCGEASGGIGQSNLAARIGVSAAQASALVEQLRQRGLLVASRAANDRRRQVWSLTSEGRSVLEAAAGSLATLAARIQPALNAREETEFAAALATLCSAVRQVEMPGEGEGFPRLHAGCELGACEHKGSETGAALGGSIAAARKYQPREVHR